MSEIKIKNKYLNKIKLINHYNKKYYDENISSVPDSDYDLLKKELIVLEEKYPYLKNSKSPSSKVGYTPSKNFKKVTHKVPMLSLGNAFSEKDLNNFEKKIIN